MPADPPNPGSWSDRDKLALAIHTPALNEQALSEYYLRRGLLPDEIERWKEAAMAGSADPKPLTRDARATWRKEKKACATWSVSCAAVRKPWPRRAACWS